MLSATLVSVNIGTIKHYFTWRNGTRSAMHKHPVKGEVSIGTLGLLGDEQADKRNHGGEDKAVFILPDTNYELFKIQQPFGFLGENLTFSDIDETQICLGDRFQIGDVTLEVTQPRSPCWKLGQHASIQDNWNASDFLKTYSDSGRVGFYCRVIQTGKVTTGQSIAWRPEKSDLPKLTIKSLFMANQFHKTEQDWQCLNTAITHPALSKAWQTAIKTLLTQRNL